MTATGGRSSREKGAKAERALVAWLRDLDIDAHRTASGYHQDGGDIYWPASPFVLDVKHQERVRLPEWWPEVAAEAAELDREPVLVLRRPNRPNPATWLALEPATAEALDTVGRTVDTGKLRLWHEWHAAELDAAVAASRPALLIRTGAGDRIVARTAHDWLTTHLQALEAPE